MVACPPLPRGPIFPEEVRSGGRPGGGGAGSEAWAARRASAEETAARGPFQKEETWPRGGAAQCLKPSALIFADRLAAGESPVFQQRPPSP